jgi:hypothetical protein
MAFQRYHPGAVLKIPLFIPLDIRHSFHIPKPVVQGTLCSLSKQDYVRSDTGVIEYFKFRATKASGRVNTEL